MPKTPEPPPGKLRVLCIYQPFIELILRGYKQLETQGKRTHVRGRLLLHAPAGAIYSSYGYEKYAPELPVHWRLQARMGMILGEVELVDCVEFTETTKLKAAERVLGDTAPGRFGWKMVNPIMYDKPIRIPGQQGFWFVDEDKVRQ